MPMDDVGDLYIIFEHFSYATNVGVQVLSIKGESLYKSPLFKEFEGMYERLLYALGCARLEGSALVYGTYQARRASGRHIFLAPSGLVYCACHLPGKDDTLAAGVIAGPFLMVDHADYLEIDVYDRLKTPPGDVEPLTAYISKLPYKSPLAARALREHLCLCAAHANWDTPPSSYPIQIDAFPYPLDKEDTFLDAVSRGDSQGAGALLNDILTQVLFLSGRDYKMLRSRVYELTVLLARAAIKGGANIDAIFGLNYAYIREIDALNGLEDVIEWLHGLTRRFRQHVFPLYQSKNIGVIYKAINYINTNYMFKITLQDMADHIFLSPTYFSKLFKDETGQTPSAFLSGVRIEASKRLLRDSSFNIADIPEMVGLDNQSYFTRVFKKSEGLTPNQYRKNNNR